VGFGAQTACADLKLAFSIEKLTEHLRCVSDEQDANAAVALLLKVERGRLSVLFVRRVQNSRDPWAGQIALPGGKREAKDKDLKETIVRETLEETNIDLLDHCRFLGVMSPFHSKPKPEVKVLPFIIIVENEPSIRLSEKELEEYFWIPLEELDRNKAMAKFSFGEVPAFTVRSNIIWGLTYGIVENFMRFLET
jgi:8-oxo-dGTP pyrophosphatase MutT (NUDIX family)